MSDVKIVEQELRFKLFYKGQLSLAYNKGFLKWGDFYLSRPNFYPVYSPGGQPVTTSSAYRYNHHRSIFLGHGNVNGTNFFHDNNPTLPDLGDIVFEEVATETASASITLHTRNGWTTKGGERVLSETRDIVWTPGDSVHVLDVASALTPHTGRVVFGKDSHAYLGIRVADTIDVEDGGRVVNSRGQEGEAGAMGQFADWVDYSGIVAQKPAGVTLMVHPANPPSPFFVRDYGTMLSNFTLMGPYVLEEGQTLTQRFRVLVHNGTADDLDIARYYTAFAGLQT